MVWFGLVSLFNGISTFMDCFILVEEQWWYYSTYSWGNKRIYTFPKGISPRVDIIVWLEFELAYKDVRVLHISHCTMGNPIGWIYGIAYLHLMILVQFFLFLKLISFWNLINWLIIILMIFNSMLRNNSNFYV